MRGAPIRYALKARARSYAATATLWAYEAEPNKQDYGWYENEVGRIMRLKQTAAPADWETTLTAWPPRHD